MNRIDCPKCGDGWAKVSPPYWNYELQSCARCGFPGAPNLKDDEALRKRQANRLKKKVQAKGLDLKLGEVYELMAAAVGFRSYNQALERGWTYLKTLPTREDFGAVAARARIFGVSSDSDLQQLRAAFAEVLEGESNATDGQATLERAG